MSINASTTNVLGYTQFNPVPNYQVDGQTQFFDPDNTILSIGAGWFIIIGLAMIFAVVATALVWADYFFKSGRSALASAEQFQTAGRSIKAGLIAVDVVSHWTWASVLLSAVTYAWLYGAAAAMYTSTSGVVTVLVFALVAIELKHKAPTAHTLLELVYVRWGFIAHIVFFFIALLTNLLVSVNMLQGMVVTATALTGMNTYAVCFIVPYGIAIYAFVGGLKATFTTSYIHTVLILVVCLIFYFRVFSSYGPLGSISTVYDNLVAVSVYVPAATNRHGSYLTAFSDGGLQLAVITTLTGYSQMVADQSYWQSAVAAAPTSAFKGYCLGAMLYGAIMFSLPFSIGLASQALNLPVADSEVFNGLAFAATAWALMGKAGVWLTLIICYMAITSSGAGELVATSSLFTFDLYRRYFRPNATNRELLIVSRTGILVWATVMGVAQTVVYKAAIPVFLTGLVISVVLGSGVPPVFMLLFWAGCTAPAAITGAVLGGLCGTSTWLAYSKIRLGAITANNLSANYSLLSGAVVSLGMSLFLCIGISLIFPNKQKFRWETFSEKIHMADDKNTGFDEDPLSPQSALAVAKARRMIWITVIVTFIFLVILWPLLTLPAVVWSKGYFTLMVVIVWILLWLGALVTIFLPIWEGRQYFYLIYTAIVHGHRKEHPDTQLRHHREVGAMKRAQSEVPLKDTDISVSDASHHAGSSGVPSPKETA